MAEEKNKYVLREEEILKFWQKNKIFEKSVEREAPKGDYVFYDGPPFATGLPHHGTLLSSIIKDVVARYWTMKGYRVPRRWGWDCHGLPIENIIENELKTSGKKDIEDKIGVDKFNEACESKVLLYTKEWEEFVARIGRWVEFDNSYKTMDPTYMESVWWAIKTIWDKGLIYEGRKVLMYCPRCETPVSKAEIAMDNSYQDITEESLTIKFKIKDPKKHGLPENTFILAWTTTPWTLPANVALAVGKDMKYSLVEKAGEKLILATELVEKVLGEGAKEEKSMPGKDLIGVEYEPLLEIPAINETGKQAWYVTDADFVSTEDGTGVVHTAVVYGEEDYQLGLEKDLPVVPLLNEKGIFNNESPELIRGKYFKDSEKDIVKYLDDQGLIFSRENFAHSYPFCWRCDTQLFYNAISAWFINIQKIKSRLIELNEKINWFPDHLKHGRFLNILETAPDWNISRNRYWATPLPFWKCDQKECEEVTCVGNVAELKEKAVNYDDVYKTDKVEEIDLHKHLMDKIKLKCKKCGSQMTRIPEVVDCWVESSSMPFAELHYPFEKEKEFKDRYPGKFIAEYIAQTRAWFYYMHVMATVLFNDISFENCVCTGTIMAAKGEKLSKSKKNYTDPLVLINKYGSDSFRYYLMSSVVMQADTLFFNDQELHDVYNKVVNILNNVVSFYGLFADQAKDLKKTSTDNVLDKWILAKLNILVQEVTTSMDSYNTVKASRPMKEFIDELSTWYLRRSRDRFKGEDEKDKQAALSTMYHVLLTLSKLLAPITPFLAEKVYQDIGSPEEESIHLCPWPEVDKKMIDAKLLEQMELARQVVEAGLAARDEAGIRVRQPLASYSTSLVKTMDEELMNIVKEELNIKELKFGKDKLEIELTPALRQEGILREMVRFVNALRKQAGLTINDQVKIYYQVDDKEIKEAINKHSDELMKSTLSQELNDEKHDVDEKMQKTVKVESKEVWLGLEKI